MLPLFAPPRTDSATLLALAVSTATNTRTTAYLCAVTSLEEIIRQTAERVASQGPLQLSRDFVADALGIVFDRIGRFDPSRASFRTWCRMVLRGRWIERLRRWRRERRHFVPWDLLAHEPPLPEAKPAMTLPAEGTWLPNEDLRHIGRWWRPVDRILLLCLSGLWTRLPPDCGERWLRDARVEGPLPAAAVWAGRDLGNCCAALAGPLGRSADTLLRHWFRRRHLLCELAWIRACLEEVA